MSKYLIRPYGLDHWYDLGLPGLEAVLSANGFGIPDIEYQTQRGYKQHGHTVKGWRLRPRTVSLTLYVAGNDYAGYLAARQKIWNLIRPNRGGAITIRRVYPDGDWRDVDCWFQGRGDDSESPQDPIIQAESLSLEFECPNPSFYDPLSKTATLSASTPAGLIFPAKFGVVTGLGTWVFRRHDEFGVASCPYSGTFRSYPVITLAGPYTTARLENQVTGAVIEMGVAIVDGETRTIDIEAQTVIDQNGVSRFTDMATANLVDFYLKPDETNTILVTATGTDANTSIAIRYYERYIAL